MSGLGWAASVFVAWSFFGATYATLACRPATATFGPAIALAAARAWVTEPVQMYPWTSGVAGLIVFLIGALSARPGIRRALTVVGCLWLAMVIAAALLARAQTNCT